jgi:hypothetical protein
MFHFTPGLIRCEECGVAVAEAAIDEHVCEHERWVTYQAEKLRDGVERLETDITVFLESARGRFELWYAERSRLAA